MFSNKILLITGGTGSFGNAVLNRFLDTDIKEIRIFSRDEKKQYDMRKKFKSNKVNFFIGDVRDYKSVYEAMRNVDYVFHAAALKQVPSCEFCPIEAVRTNILGAENVFSAAIENSVKKVIALSTDKAVYPINAMGISKAMMEKLMIAKSRNLTENETILCGTRYGNVMSSRGSVIPLFTNQIKTGKPITITNPNMTRFLMSLDEAVELVVYAFKNAKQGDIFVQKSPASTIRDLAIALKEIFNSDTKLEIIGTRHGEKMHETLLTKEERINVQENDKYFRIIADNRNLNEDKCLNDMEESTQKDYNSYNTTRLTVKEIKETLLKLDFIQNELKD